MTKKLWMLCSCERGRKRWNEKMEKSRKKRWKILWL